MESANSRCISHSAVYLLLLLPLITVSAGQNKNFADYLCMIKEDSFAFQTWISINSAWLIRKIVHGTLNVYLCIFGSHLFSMHKILCHCLSINWFYLWFKGLLKLHLSNGTFSDHPNLKRCLLPLLTIDSLRHLFNIYDFAAWENHSLVLYVEVGMLDSPKWKCQVL